jgi:tetratricopeptide (TPR) repeat protein
VALVAQRTPQLPGAAIQGAVRDSSGKPVGNASVSLEKEGAGNRVETTTDAAGVFTFATVATGRYVLSANKSGLRSPATAFPLSEGDRKHIDVVLQAPEDGVPNSNASPNQPMGFSDTPNFTVAGVTDWTAVGGHGSDSTLRTSEDLARQTLTLRAQDAAQNTSSLPAQDTQTESRLRAALATAPGSFQANHQLGEFYLHAGQFRESLPLLEASYRIDPANASNEYDLALAYKGTGDPQQAREHVQKLSAYAKSADLHRMAGELDEMLGDPLPAVQEYQRAVRLDPSEQNYLAWGSQLLVHRAIWQAAEVFKNGVKAYPKSVRLLTALSTALFAGALYEEAAQRVCEASDLDPANSEPYIFMGKIEMAAPAALPCVQQKLARFAQERPDSSLASYLYAMSLLKQQAVSPSHSAPQQVKALLTKAVSIDSRCFDAYLQLGILSASERNYEKAIQFYTKAIDIDPQLGEAHYRLGVAYDRIGEREKAKQEFQLHDNIEKLQADAVERERQQVKQFVVVQGQPATSVVQ